MGKDITKEYSNGELTIVWQPAKCIHSGICVRALPDVYNPKEKPWIKIDNATTKELKNQIETCPSGALSFYMNDEENTSTSESTSMKAEVIPNGPLMIKGTIEVKCVDGRVDMKEEKTAFCRCGASSNKPYCDGAHRKVDFKD